MEEKGATMQEARQSYDGADENARQLVHYTKRVTRRKFTSEEKVEIVVKGIRGEITASALCRREGINSGVYCRWLKDHMEAGKSRLKDDTLRDANKAEVEALKQENGRLKELIAELSVDTRRRYPICRGVVRKRQLVRPTGSGLHPKARARCPMPFDMVVGTPTIRGWCVRTYEWAFVHSTIGSRNCRNRSTHS